ncbi:methylated-DNA--[protein]-cysteine S-methyltransferase [Calidifontibacter sp. DB0510]|uniref:methylated-DNA--[protein]-cysteine S-methyltransferase n=1 Tax=Metallococcus carri TaxID=1656884 RepID=A0A967AYD2_9MICO|nr:methylated-DNA--[protein]-cysteine S-methyltransferase [Metallococcus carri]NHN54697.1 methylated-DNA--[protein]-cysteine S-methyltransferase [Metallococcus carri]NOP37042.1 methylated-DNA--[protein]-cysteine S-methyltransferase [Calidifontibacter sp. DB2511S]
MRFDVDDTRLDDLRERLADSAYAGGDLDLAYRTVDSPVGELLLAATETGVVRVAFAREDFDAVLARLADAVGSRILLSRKRFDHAQRELEEYFAGSRSTFDLPLDRRLSHGFRGEVQRQLSSIGYGTTSSYGRLAQQLGHPRAARAVGSACATNPLPILVPCHRVLRSDGSIGEYAGGQAAKRVLLELEARAG